MKTLILLFPIQLFDRKEAENIQEQKLDSHDLIKLHDRDIKIIDLSDYMDLMNNQEYFDMDEYWMSYVMVEKEIVNKITTYLQD